MERDEEAKRVVYGLYCTCPECEEMRPGNIRYVGLTIVGAKYRLYRHRNTAKTGGKYASAAWIRKHGLYNIKYLVLEVQEDLELLKQAEIRWIRELGTHKSESGVNISPGGDLKDSLSVSELARATASRLGKERIGEKSHVAVFKEDEIRLVYEMWWRGHTGDYISQHLGKGSKTAVRKILAGQVWSHVPYPLGPRCPTKRKVPTRVEKSYARGESTNHNVMTEDSVRELRELWSSGEYRTAALAEKFGISVSTVKQIVKHVTWKHVE